HVRLQDVHSSVIRLTAMAIDAQGLQVRSRTVATVAVPMMRMQQLPIVGKIDPALLALPASPGAVGVGYLRPILRVVVCGGLHRSAAWLEREDRAVALEERGKVEILANGFPDPRRLAGALVVQLRQAVQADEQGRMTFALL